MGGSETVRRLLTVKRVYSFWGRHPWLYAAQDWITFMGRHDAIRRRAVDQSGSGPGDRVLEVACGTGRNFRYVEQRIGPKGRLVGLDYSDEMLAAARDLSRQRGWSNVKLVQGDAAILDVGDEAFDAVVSVLGMSAIPDYVAAIERCRDVLRPGGVLSICDARPFTGALRIINPLVRAVYTSSAAWDPNRDMPAQMHRVFGNVSVTSLNLGTFFFAASQK